MKKFGSILFLLLSTTACSTHFDNTKTTLPTASQVTESFVDEPAEVVETIQTRKSKPANPLPEKTIGPLEMAGVNLADMMLAFSNETGIAVAFDDGVKNKNIDLYIPNKISFKAFTDILKKQHGITAKYEDGIVFFYATERYTVNFPLEKGERLEKVASNIRDLGATNVIVNGDTASISFTSNYNVKKQIDELVEAVRSDYVEITYDIYIFEKSIDNSANLGINVTGLTATLAGAGIGISAVNTLDGAGGFSMTVDKGSFAGVVSAVKKSGDTTVVASPTQKVLSGNTVEMTVGDERYFIKEVSSTVTTGSSTNANAGSGTKTEKLNSGLTIKLTGHYRDGLISTFLNIDNSQLTGFAEFDTGTVKQQLPIQNKRKVDNTIIGKPGEISVFAGIRSKNKSETGNGFAFIPTNKKEELKETELIFVIRPRIKRYEWQ